MRNNGVDWEREWWTHSSGLAQEGRGPPWRPRLVAIDAAEGAAEPPGGVDFGGLRLAARCHPLLLAPGPPEAAPHGTEARGAEARGAEVRGAGPPLERLAAVERAELLVLELASELLEAGACERQPPILSPVHVSLSLFCELFVDRAERLAVRALAAAEVAAKAQSDREGGTVAAVAVVRAAADEATAALACLDSAADAERRQGQQHGRQHGQNTERSRSAPPSSGRRAGTSGVSAAPAPLPTAVDRERARKTAAELRHRVASAMCLDM
eukprot:794438-Prymnesium_polylepis.1